MRVVGCGREVLLAVTCSQFESMPGRIVMSICITEDEEQLF